MPLRDAFSKLVDKVEQKISPSPPAIPNASKPVYYSQQYQQQYQSSHQQPQQSFPAGHNTANATTYYAWQFHPSRPLTEDWNQETGQHGWGNNELENYTTSRDNSFVTPDGKLIIRAAVNKRQPEQSEKFTSARLTSKQRLGRQQGCLRVRLTAPCAQGVWPAFWLLPTDPFSWPTDGEIDIHESWNGDPTNHTCLHWGHFNGPDSQKHRVLETPIPRLTHPNGTEYALAWQQPPNGIGGKLVWYIDGQPVMRAEIPQGTRKMEDWRIIVNVALGGNVCQGVVPSDGAYEFVVHEMRLDGEPMGGWQGFERDWRRAREGHTM